MWINEKPLSSYGGRLKREYAVSGLPLENNYFKGRKSSAFVLMETAPGLLTLSLPVVFEGEDRKDVTVRKSSFDRDVYGKSELAMDDGFLYSVFLNEIGESIYPSDCLLECTYVFMGYRHGQKITGSGNTMYCESTYPYTDCMLTAVPTKNRSNYLLGTVLFPQVQAGEVLTVDGIHKRILVNGIPAADRAQWISFPSMVPGKNVILCPDIVNWEYEPIYF